MDANYNLSGLTDRIKARLKDAQYSDTDIQQFINDAYFEILGDTHYQFLEKKWRTTTQFSGVVPLPCDYQTLIHFTAKSSKTKQPLTYISSGEYFDHDKHGSLNNYKFTVYGNEVLYSVPNIEDETDEDGDEDFYTLSLYYLAKPKMLVQPTDVPVIPYEYGEAIVLGALARAEQLRDNFDYAQIYENKKEDLVLSMKERYCPRQLEGDNRAQLPVREYLRH